MTLTDIQAEVQAGIDNLLALNDKLAKFVMEAAPTVATIAAPLGGDGQAVAAGANLADMIATLFDNAFQAHVAAGSTPQSAVTALATIATGLTTTPGVNLSAKDVTQINTLAAAAKAAVPLIGQVETLFAGV